MKPFLKQWLPRLAFIALCVPGVAAQAALNLELPEIGDASGGTISPIEERRIGEEFMRQVRQQLKIIDDPEINEYVQSLGYRLAANSDNQSQDFTFFIIDDPAINAFAAPGGFIGINSGLILASESESELASVLAHEIAHITQHHLARAFEKGGKLGLMSVAGMIAAILVGTQNSELGQAALAATQAGSAQAQINFTRGNEEEADRIGIKTLARADFDTRSMASFFERLQKSMRFAGASVPEFLRTHPVTTSRIADSRNRAEQFPYRQIVDSQIYHLVRAKLRVLNEPNPKQAISRFAQNLKQGQYRNEKAEQYGYALALLSNRDYDAARTQMSELLTKDSDSLPYQLALARIEIASGNTGKGLDIYTGALKLYPGNHPLTMLYGRALLQTGQAAQARVLLQKHVRQHAANPELYKILAEAEGQTGHKAAGHQALAEYYYLNGHTGAAVEQLEIALRTPDSDFYQSSQIEDRLAQLKDQLKLETKR
ncbi:MAG: M48 family metalloprotease [Gammaproteobacteria bacterium]